MSYDLIFYEMMRRQEIFKNLSKYLNIVVKVAKEIDETASIYLFGSVAEGKYTIASEQAI